MTHTNAGELPHLRSIAPESGALRASLFLVAWAFHHRSQGGPGWRGGISAIRRLGRLRAGLAQEPDDQPQVLDGFLTGRWMCATDSLACERSSSSSRQPSCRRLIRDREGSYQALFDMIPPTLSFSNAATCAAGVPNARPDHAFLISPSVKLTPTKVTSALPVSGTGWSSFLEEIVRVRPHGFLRTMPRSVGSDA